MRRDVFQRIADPTRREFVFKSLNVNAVAENFPLSRAAIYKPMGILAECGLLGCETAGWRQYCLPEREI